MVELSNDGDVHILRMDNEENRFNADSISDLHDALDRFDAVEGPKALVTVGDGKFFSNGLDLDWLLSPESAETPDFMDDINLLFGRILFNHAPTAAAINGHAFAAGAMLACAHDFRVMRADRGFLCIPEVDLGLPLTPGMTAVLQARVPPAALHQAVVTGKRWGGEELVEHSIVEATAPEEEVLATAITWAASQTHHAGETLGTMKRGLYPAAFEILISSDAEAEAEADADAAAD